MSAMIMGYVKSPKCGVGRYGKTVIVSMNYLFMGSVHFRNLLPLLPVLPVLPVLGDPRFDSWYN